MSSEEKGRACRLFLKQDFQELFLTSRPLAKLLTEITVEGAALYVPLLLCEFYHPLLKSLASNTCNFHTQTTQKTSFNADVRVWLEKKKPLAPEICTLLDLTQQVKTLPSAL